MASCADQSVAADALRVRLLMQRGRLAGVTIDDRPCADCIAQYDGRSTLFVLDPPDWGNEGSYGKGLFERADFGRLAAILSKSKGIS